ncbi:isoprenylcysteine carboxyl methyltransferase [Pelosinus sp. IPA-1]|nr:isoprenylcysteine carboxylmethyltransferase family protein [Pelosinus sp. IPA-1]GMB01561.1 isoprenylcysteine carboxyl methyltransferase [Pelosinus sp. IPA-1]
MSDYGLWPIVVINSLIFIIFAFSFTRPRSGRDWRSFGTFSAFIVALFAEMYGFPLSIYLLSGWLGSHYPQINLYSHDAGHLWYTLLGLVGDPHHNPIHELSNWFIFGGLIFLGFTWRFLHSAQRRGVIAISGPYAYVRHPQYIAFIVILFGFLLQWPTLLTLAMFPILVRMYIWLARQEEREAMEQFGEDYAAYAAVTPRFFPRLGRRGLVGSKQDK